MIQGSRFHGIPKISRGFEREGFQIPRDSGDPSPTTDRTALEIEQTNSESEQIFSRIRGEIIRKRVCARIREFFIGQGVRIRGFD